MSFEGTKEQELLRKTAQDVCRQFDDEYWREIDQSHRFPIEFWNVCADAGFMGEHLYGLTFHPPLGQAYYPRATSVFRKPYRTKDGYISVLVYKDKHWKSFFTMIGKPELLEDERFKDLQARTEHIHELYQLVEEALQTKTTREWMNLLEKAEIPVAPLHDVEGLLEDPHLQQIGFFEKVEHPTEGTILNIGFPVRFSRTPAHTQRLAPRLGEHSVEVLREFGLQEEEIRQLVHEGVTINPAVDLS